MKDIDDFKRKGPSIWSFLFMGVIGAVIGSFLTLSFAPAYMYEELPSGDDSVNTAYTPNGNTNPEECLSYAVRSIRPSLVSVATVKEEKEDIKILSSCTGFVIDSSGYILTGYQADSKNIYVYLSDKKSFPAKVVWFDKSMDISILKIEKTGLTAATLGNSDKQEMGDTVAAVEAILGDGFEFRLNSGIINATGRSIIMKNKECLQNLLQSQASAGCMEPGGTPLINSAGEVIGVNISMISDTKEEGFAIPINLIKPVIYSISQGGEVKEPDLGIEGIDKTLAKQRNIEVESGIYINKIIPGGGAELAGLSLGDVIISVSGNSVNTLTELKSELYKVGVGNIANLKIKYKDGTVDYVGVILKEKNEE